MISYLKDKYNSIINYLKDKHNRNNVLIVIGFFLGEILFAIILVEGLAYEDKIRQEEYKKKYENYKIYDEFLEYEKAKN